MADTTAIPEPPSYPLIGHLGEIDRSFPLGSFVSLAERYGEIVRLRMPTMNIVVASTHALVDELCDEKRFRKIPAGALAQVRNGVHDGLFTARLEEPNWAVAHRVLMPAFGPMGIRDMFDEMHDIASQLVMKWARQGPKKAVTVTDDFTRLALDTLSLCSMGFRFNSFYSDEMHPFIEAMGDFLVESGRRAQRAPLPAFFYRAQDTKYEQDIKILRETAETVLRERESGQGADRKDLLAAMLNGRDPQTGRRMADDSIIDNLITFLIAGHETTSGLLSYTMYQLLKHPEEYRKVQQEVDEVVGKGPITVQHLQKLPYIAAVLRETLRLSAPIPIIALQPIEDTILGGKYPVHKGEQIALLLAKSQLDPAVFEDPTSFKPARMLDEEFNKLPRNSWKPFGNGVRACIGRPFAWQEAILVLALLFQNFNFVLDDPNYNLHHKQTLTIKPKDFYIRAVLREGLTPTSLDRRLFGKEGASPTADKSGGSTANSVKAGAGDSGLPLTILYGSNSGTCESMAQRLAADAQAHGFRPSTVDCMDVANEKLPTDQPVVVITASYEGQPPDNAAHFVSWIDNIKDNSALSAVKYAVFGCGHSDWSQTFHRVPKLVDTKLEAAGAKRLATLGLSDAAGDDMFSVFETWEDEVLWPALQREYKVEVDSEPAAGQGSGSAGLSVTVSSPRPTMLRQDVREAQVVASRVLTAEGEPVKRHLEVRLPSDMTYRAGDYLAVLPLNPRETVERVMRKFELPWDASLDIAGGAATGTTTLPTGVSIPAQTLFSGYVELAQPATRRNVLGLVEATADEKDKEQLRALAGDAYSAEVAAKRVSVLDLLEKYPSLELPLGSFLGMLPPMRVRQYSISSSPLWNPAVASITFSLLQEPSRSGQGEHLGVASSYMHGLQAGDRLHVAVRPSHAAFHLPQDPEQTPIICVAAGTGLAPYRGFVQERAAMLREGRRRLAPALLYYGCREPGRDDLYTDELAEWERLGAVEVRRAYSRTPEKVPGGESCRYVQDALWADRERLRDIWAGGAKLYVCGSRRVGQAVEDVAIRIRRDGAEAKGIQLDEADGAAWWSALRNVRYATDVFD